jgi:hypothetical protein
MKIFIIKKIRLKFINQFLKIIKDMLEISHSSGIRCARLYIQMICIMKQNNVINK